MRMIILITIIVYNQDNYPHNNYNQDDYPNNNYNQNNYPDNNYNQDDNYQKYDDDHGRWFCLK